MQRRVNYVGSSEHKSYPSFAGPPKLRSDASKCDPALGDQSQLTAWLRAAVASGDFGAPWEGGFPKYVWYRDGQQWYEARLTNREQGEYKGYPLKQDELPEGIK